MQLDVVTLAAAGIFVTFLCGFVLLGTWWFQYRSNRALAFWSGANLADAFGVLLLAATAAGSATMHPLVSSTLLGIGPLLTWIGARGLEGRRSPALLVAGGSSVAVVGFLIASALAAPRWDFTVTIGFAAICYLGAASELWRGRGENLAAKWVLMAFLAGRGVFFLISSFVGPPPEMADGQLPPINSWFGLIHFEQLIYVIGTTVFLLALLRERSEERHKHAAQVDALTGLFNRRAFMEAAERALKRSVIDRAPLFVVMLDLDHFKAINDTYGHAIGDRVLILFGGILRRVLRPSDIVGRIGGEEFAFALSGAGPEAALAIAERVRASFAAEAHFFEGKPVGATVSAGVAAIPPNGPAIDDVLGAADRALYRAKSRGRNQVAVDGGAEDQLRASSNVIRVA
jgi:diguanylate cyclase (GGDEF)-like protein